MSNEKIKAALDVLGAKAVALKEETADDVRGQISKLTDTVNELTGKVSSVNVDALNSEIEEFRKQVGSFNKEFRNLGMFAGGKKKELKAKIAELEGKIASNQASINLVTEKNAAEVKLAAAQEKLNRLLEAENTEKAVETLSYDEAVDIIHHSFVDLTGVKLPFKSKHLLGKWGGNEIGWRVLKHENGKALIISRECLDCRQYNTENKEMTWENCSLRQWLNGEFYDNAFTDEEKQKILSTTLHTEGNSHYHNNGGNDTIDKVFLLSENEARAYFSADEKRCANCTDFAKGNGAYVDTNGHSWWWLRTPGKRGNQAQLVTTGGLIGVGGNDVDYALSCVRPAMWIEL